MGNSIGNQLGGCLGCSDSITLQHPMSPVQVYRETEDGSLALNNRAKMFGHTKFEDFDEEWYSNDGQIFTTTESSNIKRGPFIGKNSGSKGISPMIKKPINIDVDEAERAYAEREAKKKRVQQAQENGSPEIDQVDKESQEDDEVPFFLNDVDDEANENGNKLGIRGRNYTQQQVAGTNMKPVRGMTQLSKGNHTNDDDESEIRRVDDDSQSQTTFQKLGDEMSETTFKRIEDGKSSNTQIMKQSSDQESETSFNRVDIQSQASRITETEFKREGTMNEMESASSFQRVGSQFDQSSVDQVKKSTQDEFQEDLGFFKEPEVPISKHKDHHDTRMYMFPADTEDRSEDGATDSRKSSEFVDEF